MDEANGNEGDEDEVEEDDGGVDDDLDDGEEG